MRLPPTQRTPWVAILVVGVSIMAMSFVGDVGTLANTTVLLLVLVFISAHLSAIVLKKDEVAHRYFRTPTVVNVLALIASVALLTQQSLTTWLIGIGYLVTGSALFFLARAFGRRAIKPVNLD